MSTLMHSRRWAAGRGLVLAAVLFSALPARAEWVVDPVDLSLTGGWSLHLDVNSEGTPHAAYYTLGGNMKYKYRQSGAFVDGGTIPSGDAFALDLNNDRFFISTPSPNFYPQLQILLGNNLLLGQQVFGGRISEVVQLEFSSSNRPHIAFVDTAARQLKHAAWNGVNWVTRVVATGNEFQYGNSSFTATLDAQEAMHFVWQDSTDSLRYARPNTTGWTLSSPFPAANARPYDLTVDEIGHVHLAYDVFTGNVHTGGLHYSKYNGSTWTGSRVSGLDNFGVGSTQVVVDDARMPHLFTFDSAFTGPDVLKHVFLQDNTWANEPIDSRTNTSSGAEDIDAMYVDGQFHVLFSTGDKEVLYAYQPQPEDPADFNGDGIPDGDDLTMWGEGFALDDRGDADADGDTDGSDFLIWQQRVVPGASGVAQIPEPATALLMTGLALATVARGRRVTR